jgi:2-polyprenyl-3-methyl-5-hydroxy-6-metoxy-1,4-benzoquinol methylase
MTGRYAGSYHDNTVYANVVALVQQHARPGDVVVDLGCGHGLIAEPLRELGFGYLGIDAVKDGIEDLHARGFEALHCDLLDLEAVEGAVATAVEGRRVAAFTVIDVLEHIQERDLLLDAVHRMATVRNGVPLVVSVPNVSHFDVMAKLLVGKWDATRIGLLDDTHVAFLTEESLEAQLRGCGWFQVGAKDFLLHRSDQHFPEDLLSLRSATPLNNFLVGLRSSAKSSAFVSQFVRAYLPGPSAATQGEPGPAPFLSVLTRTRGDRLNTLAETLLCLASQTCTDFEVLILAHDVEPLTMGHIEYLVTSLPPAVAAKVRAIPVTGGGRCRPLNVGLEHAQGEYIAILDDDDLVLGNWVEEFERMARQSAGRVLRTTVVEQDITSGQWVDRPGHTTAGPIRVAYPASFDLVQHFVANQSPPCGLAFPRSLFRDLGLAFDEGLPVLEDWDILLQAALLCGVESSPAITSIYHRWSKGVNSSSLHSQYEWNTAHEAVISKLDKRALVFPPGVITALRKGRCDLAAAEATATAAQAEVEVKLEQQSLEIRTLRQQVADSEAVRLRQLHELATTFRASTSWRLAAPARAVSRIARRRGANRPAGLV